MVGHIHIRNLRFRGHHGVLPEETRLGQPFELDLVLTLDLNEASQNDDLTATVNYAEVCEQCRQIVEGPPVKLIESLARRILETLLQSHPRLQSAAITLRKPQAPIAAEFDFVAVETKLTRDDCLPRPRE